MVNSKSLVNTIGDLNTIEKYYDNWSKKYEITLSHWDYQAPKKSINLLKKKLPIKPKKILDLACGTGLFGEELIKVYNKSKIYGSDISKNSLLIAKKKNIYIDLVQSNFEKKRKDYKQFNLVSLIGAMTYCKNFENFFSNIEYYLIKKGYFVFSHRTDLWEKQDFTSILSKISNKFLVKFISRPTIYLPLNKDFRNVIKMRLVLLQKI